MVVIKKIRLELVEKYLEDVVVLSSQIKISQEELKYVKSRMDNNKMEFSSGDISDSLFKTKRINLEKEEKKLNNKIKSNIKKSANKLQAIRNVLNKVEI